MGYLPKQLNNLSNVREYMASTSSGFQSLLEDAQSVYNQHNHYGQAIAVSQDYCKHQTQGMQEIFGELASTSSGTVSLTTPTTKENKTMFKSFNEYISQHKNVLFTILIGVVADKFIFKGKLTEKLQSMLDKFISKGE